MFDRLRPLLIRTGYVPASGELIASILVVAIAAIALTCLAGISVEPMQ